MAIINICDKSPIHFLPRLRVKDTVSGRPSVEVSANNCGQVRLKPIMIRISQMTGAAVRTHEFFIRVSATLYCLPQKPGKMDRVNPPDGRVTGVDPMKSQPSP
ncbi:unnamed protein product [Protopolystoma xenopodis]|uniref:Uncharacterized protein n=1 Tax=Protopolystoma xenopodis TaxID=117903 RepID=A0A448XD31_9PLAT|nr:unnamed protein product [Protopolystoma xenopodis]